MFRMKSISSVLILSVAASVVLAVAVIILYVVNSSNSMVLDLEKQAMQETVRSSQEALDDFMGKAAAVMQALSSQRSVQEAFAGETDSMNAQIKDFLKSNPDFWSVTLFNTKGVVIAGGNAGGEDLRGQTRGDRDYAKAVLAGQELFLSQEVFKARGNAGEALIFAVARPIKAPDGTILGGIGVFPRWEDFTKTYIDPIRFGERGYGFILDTHGRFIAHAMEKGAILKDVSDQFFVKKVLEMKKGVLFYEWEGEKKFLSFASHPKTGWIVCMSAYISELAETANRQRNILLGTGAGAVTVLVATILFFVSRLVVRPINDIEAFTGRIAQGDFKAELRTGFRFEFHSLAENIRVMVAELKNKLGFAQGVLDGIVLPCLVVDKENKATFINTHMMRALDKDGDPRQHFGETSGAFIYGDSNHETVSRKALLEKRRLDTETVYTTGKGTTKDFNVTATPINDLDGNLLGSLAIWFELTEIRAQQKRIEAQNEKIAKAAAQANTISDQVASASEELSAQIEQSSRGSEEQRSRTGEAATAMEEMNATVMEVAKSASNAADLADRTKAKAQEGASLVDAVVGTINQINSRAEDLKTDMTELGRQAEGIGQIMTVIADIADQTNLLALNAAIEAARAGDAGRGFAVVADEVRKLAEKTMTATNEVGNYIRAVQDSARKNIQSTEATTAAIHESTATANQSGAALREIVDMVEKTADQVRGIATASEEQSAASEEINRTTDEINRIAAETAEAMTQSAQAVGDLARLAQGLKDIIHDMQN